MENNSNNPFSIKWEPGEFWIYPFVQLKHCNCLFFFLPFIAGNFINTRKCERVFCTVICRARGTYLDFLGELPATGLDIDSNSP